MSLPATREVREVRLTPSPPRRRARRTGARLAVAMAATALLTSGCDLREVYENTFSLGTPYPVTDQGRLVYDMWLATAAAGAIVGAFVWALIGFAGFRYRKRSEEIPRQVRYNLPIEVLYTVVPFVVIAVLFYYTVITENYINELKEESEGEGRPDVTIGVIGFQWNWTFNYDDQNPATVDPSVTGIPGQPAQLIIPTNRTVRFVQTSNDVVHGFWVPKFLFKRENIPGRVNQFEITARTPGTYIGRCTELCGEKHDRMNFEVKVVPEQEYDTFIAQQRAPQPPTNEVPRSDVPPEQQNVERPTALSAPAQNDRSSS